MAMNHRMQLDGRFTLDADQMPTTSAVRVPVERGRSKMWLSERNVQVRWGDEQMVGRAEWMDGWVQERRSPMKQRVGEMQERQSETEGEEVKREGRRDESDEGCQADSLLLSFLWFFHGS